MVAGGGLALFGQNVADQHGRPFRRQKPHGGRSDPAGPAGHQRNFSIDSHLLVLPTANPDNGRIPAPSRYVN